MSIKLTDIPHGGFLQNYADIDNCHTDCFVTEVAKQVSFADYAKAFFSSPIFKLERHIIALTLRKPTNEQDVADLISGASDRFAVWQVENRADNQLLMKVGDGQIRTWLMVEEGADHTKLYFGSAVLPKDENGSMGFIFYALMGFHKLYARLLLWLAKRGV